MAKGDHSRSQNRIDEQMKQAQGWNTGVQQNLANNWGNFNNLFWGGNPYGGSQTGGTFGYGSTVPHFSWTGNPYYSGNGTDTPTPISGSGYNQPLNSGYYSQQDVQSRLMPFLQSLGPANSQTLERALPQIQQMFPGTTRDNSQGPLDELNIPGVGIVDFIHGAESGAPDPNWTFQTGGGGMMGMGGYGSIPGMNIGDYQNLLGMYKNLFGDLSGKYGSFLGSAAGMAQSGGLSEADKANMRARAISPIRAVYENSLRNVNRQKALQGGYSPGYTTAMGRFNREMGQGVSDATTNAEAGIAELVQRGKLGGLGAWGSGLSGMASGLGGLLGGMGSLYGTQPGLSRLFGDQQLQSMQQMLSMGGLQNALSLGLLGAQNQTAGIPGNFQSALSNINGALGLGGSLAGIFTGLGGLGMLGGGPSWANAGATPWSTTSNPYSYGMNY